MPLLLLQFVPLLNVVAPVLLFLFGAWMFALEYLDYPMGNHGALFREVRAARRASGAGRRYRLRHRRRGAQPSCRSSTCS